VSRHLWILLTFLSAAIGTDAAIAQVASTDYTIHQQFLSVRALGMGNAFAAVVDDTSAFYYNPAALAFRKRHELKMSLGAGLDTKVLNLNKQINAAKGQPDQASQVTAVTNLLQENVGNYYSIRAPTVGGFFAWPHWEVAFIPADLSVDMSVHQCAGPCLNVNGFLDTTLAASYGHELHWLGKDDKLAWGTTIKSVHRLWAGEEIFAADLVNGTNIFSADQAHEGVTFDMDLGTMWAPGVAQHGFFSFLKYMKPTFAVVGHNLLNYGFKTNPRWIKGVSGSPPPLGRKMDVGSKFELPKFWIFENRIAVDERDIGDDNWTWSKGLHTGFESYWTVANWWKGHWSVGFNQGYISGGVGAKFGWCQFDFATYAEEVGTESVPKQSRRYMAELALDF